jgi:hypothetical protein
MQAKQLFDYLETLFEQGSAAVEHEVLLRVAGRDYAIQRLEASTVGLVLEAREAVLHADALQGTSGDVPRAELSQETATPEDAQDAFAAAAPEATIDVTPNRQSPREEKGSHRC